MSKWIAEFDLEDGDRMPEHMDLEYHGVKLDFHCRPLEQEPCEDAVSRKEVINQIFYSTDNNGDVVLGSALRERIARLPSVTPQEPKKGHWVKEESIFGWDGYSYQCSECGRSIHLDTEMEDLEDYPYCHCGAKMQEVKE